MVDRARRSPVVRSPRYLRLAIPGLVLVLLSGVFWGQGWWPWLALFVGIGLIVLPSRPLRRTGTCVRTRRPATGRALASASPAGSARSLLHSRRSGGRRAGERMGLLRGVACAERHRRQTQHEREDTGARERAQRHTSRVSPGRGRAQRSRLVHTHVRLPSGSARTTNDGALSLSTTVPPAATAASMRSSAMSCGSQRSTWKRWRGVR